jgi:hypothetical protein
MVGTHASAPRASARLAHPTESFISCRRRHVLLQVAKTIEVKASHLSLISQPAAVSQLILQAAGQTA